MATGHGAVSPGDLLAGAVRPAGALVRRWAEREALRQLAQPGCPACRAAGAAEERFAHSFVVELYADFRFQDRLARSAGFCPRHTRRLLVRREAPWVVPAAYRRVVEEAANGLARSGGRALAAAPCPACERAAEAEQGAIRVLLWALVEPEISEAYRRHGGLCLRHVVPALAEDGGGAVAGLLLDVALERCGSSSPSPSLADLVGVDPDAPLRAGARRALAASAGARRRRSTIGSLKARLRSGACPICLAAGVRERDYLEWLALETHAAGGRATAADRWLCAGHLHDLALLDAQSAAAIARHQLADLWHRLQRVRCQLDAVPPRGAGPRLHAAVRAWHAKRRASAADRVREALRQLAGSRRSALSALGEVLRGYRCTACRVGTEAEARERALLAAAMHDSSVWSCYRRSRGLCARHAGGLEAYGPRGARMRETVIGRLLVLGWELEEASRKAAWAARHEPRGPEASAWLRAAGQLDGRVFLGGRPHRVARGWGVLAAGPDAAGGPIGPRSRP
jgi:hypothetical protein